MLTKIANVELSRTSEQAPLRVYRTLVLKRSPFPLASKALGEDLEDNTFQKGI